MSKKQHNLNLICQNKKATFDYFIKDNVEAGIVLQGWEVKSVRAKKVGLADSYIFIKKGEAFLLGSNFSPLENVGLYIKADPQRTRKLLLHKKQIDQLKGHVQVKGQALIATKLYWKNGKVKVEIGIASGKKQHDKRESIKQSEWKREKDRLVKFSQR